MSADDIPARHDRLAAAMLTPLVDHGLREAVKWVMEPELIAMEAEIERRVRAKVAEEIEAQKTGCRDHPMPLPKPSCWTCARDGAFNRAAGIARGEQ